MPKRILKKNDAIVTDAPNMSHAKCLETDHTVEFVCSVAPIAGAVDFHGDEGTRLTLDIPETEKAKALTLPAYFLRKVLRCKLTIMEV